MMQKLQESLANTKVSMTATVQNSEKI